MSIKRAPRPETRYYVLSKDISEDMRLSWDARGLLIYLLGKPDNWQVSIPHLIKQTVPSKRKNARRDLIRAIIAELVDLGYMTAATRRNDGSFDGVDYIVHEKPFEPPILDDSPQPDLPSPVNPPLPDLPLPDLPLPDLPSPVDPHLINNDLNQSNDLLAKNDIKQIREAKNSSPSVLPKQKQAKQSDNAVHGDLPDWVPVDAWIAFVEMRKAMGQRGKLTAHAAKLIINKLEELKNQGNDPRQVLEQSVMNNWRSVFPIKQQYVGKQQALEQRNRAAAEQFANGGDW